MSAEPLFESKPQQELIGEEVVNWDSVILHLDNVEANIMKYVGKPEHNPYIMVNELGLKKLKRRLAKGERSKELYEEIMKLSLDSVPHVSKLKSLDIPEGEE